MRRLHACTLRYVVSGPTTSSAVGCTPPPAMQLVKELASRLSSVLRTRCQTRITSTRPSSIPEHQGFPHFADGITPCAAQLVSEPELEALITVLRTALDRGSWPPLPLTAALLRNALEGSHPAPQPAGPVANATQLTADGASAAAGNGHSAAAGERAGSSGAGSSDVGSSMSSPAAGATQHLQQQTAAVVPEKQRLQQLHQQLAACLIVKLARRALEAPPQEAYAQLASFALDVEPAAAGDAGSASVPQQPAQTDGMQPAAAAMAAAAAAAAALPAGAGPAADAAGGLLGLGEPTTSMAQPVMAAEVG